MLTLAQQRTYRFIKQYLAEHGYAPTVSEVAKGIGIKSKGVAHRYIQAIVEAGKLQIEPGRHRNLALAAQEEEAMEEKGFIPLIGKIAAGQPIEAIANQEFLDVQALLGGLNRYALRVQGDSMIEEGIFDGDVVICETCNTANHNDIVVALIEDEAATLKRFQRNKDGTITLNPANALLKPMTYSAEKVRVQGRFVGLLRLG